MKKQAVKTTEANEIEALMKKFKLVDMRHEYRNIIAEAERENLSYEDFLRKLLLTEASGKKSRRQEKLVKEARFESLKTLDQIDYSFNPSLNCSQISELGNLDFIRRHENVIIIGPPGVGKTMIATGLGMNACSEGFRVLFANANDLIGRLSEVAGTPELGLLLNELNKIPLLIIDELSYIKMDKEKESLFFQIIRQRYEKSSLVITTNLPMGRWDELFTGQIAATAILDRLVHHCTVMSITGDSYRVKGSK